MLLRLHSAGIRAWPLAGTFILAALSAVANLLPVQGIGILVSILTGSVPDQTSVSSLWIRLVGTDPTRIAASVVAVLLLSGLLSAVYGLHASAMGVAFGARLRGLIAEAITESKMRALLAFRTGDITSRMVADVETVQSAITAPLIALLVRVIEVVWVLYVFSSWNPRIAAWSLLPVPLLFFVTLMYNRRTEHRTRAQRQEIANLASSVEEACWVAPIVRLMDSVGFIHGRLIQTIMTLLRREMAIQSGAFIYWVSVRFIQGIGYATVMLGTVRLTLAGFLTAGDILVAWLFLQRLYGPVLEFSRFGNLLKQGQVCLERVTSLTSLPRRVKPLYRRELPEPPTLEAVGLAFSYPTGKPVLTNLSCRVPSGSFTAVVGQSGEGKSTLAMILCGLYEADQGTLSWTVDGIPVTPRIAYVNDAALLFSGTVSDNLSFGNPLSPSTVEAIARHVDPDLLPDLPSGHLTEVGERGTNLSTGQRQRIALMRAIHTKPSVIVLDEATSGLDPGTEGKVLSALEQWKQHSTVICITHRVSCLRTADLVLVMEDGSIAEQGTFLELARPGTKFYGLFERELGLDTIDRPVFYV